MITPMTVLTPPICLWTRYLPHWEPMMYRNTQVNWGTDENWTNNNRTLKAYEQYLQYWHLAYEICNI